MTSVREYNDGKTAEGCDGALPSDYPDGTSILHRVSLDKVCNNEYDEITDRDQSNDTCVFQRVQPP